MAATDESEGSPLLGPAKLLTNWWTAAFAMPYPIIPTKYSQMEIPI